MMGFQHIILAMLGSSAFAAIEVDGVEIEVVDAHLHTLETPGHFNREGKASIIRQLPAFVVPYYSALSEQISDPFAPVLGIGDQLEWAGVDRGVVLATYTHHTVGYATNRYIEKLVWDDRNDDGTGRPWFWGMASINLDDFADESIRTQRLDALKTYLANPRIIGIKMAHAHQGVAFNDPSLDDLYALAAEMGTPLLLHTGVSPFPGTKRDSDYTNPTGLMAAVERFNGLNDDPRVEFVLSHVGTADAGATKAALEMTAANDNVWLEISALGQDMIYDIDGSESSLAGPQYPWIIQDILDLGLVNQTIFATDGPQQSGKVRGYLSEIVESMKGSGYTTEQMARVLSGSFYDCFGVSD